jgi:hypothetical protein
VSRRKQRSRGRSEAGGARPRAPAERGPERAATGGRAAPGWGLAFQIAFVVAVFGLGVLVAELAGAANLGVSFGIGQIAFAIAVVYLLVRR